jgi:hypothetical protein
MNHGLAGIDPPSIWWGHTNMNHGLAGIDPPSIWRGHTNMDTDIRSDPHVGKYKLFTLGKFYFLCAFIPCFSPSYFYSVNTRIYYYFLPCYFHSHKWTVTKHTIHPLNSISFPISNYFLFYFLLVFYCLIFSSLSFFTVVFSLPQMNSYKTHNSFVQFNFLPNSKIFFIFWFSGDGYIKVLLIRSLSFTLEKVS